MATTNVIRAHAVIYFNGQRIVLREFKSHTEAYSYSKRFPYVTIETPPRLQVDRSMVDRSMVDLMATFASEIRVVWPWPHIDSDFHVGSWGVVTVAVDEGTLELSPLSPEGKAAEAEGRRISYRDISMNRTEEVKCMLLQKLAQREMGKSPKESPKESPEAGQGALSDMALPELEAEIAKYFPEAVIKYYSCNVGVTAYFGKNNTQVQILFKEGDVPEKVTLKSLVGGRKIVVESAHLSEAATQLINALRAQGAEVQEQIQGQVKEFIKGAVSAIALCNDLLEDIKSQT